MLEKAFKGSRLYRNWLLCLLGLMALGLFFYLIQLREGLTVTGMSRDVSWGLYIGQFTFIVGVAASAVMLVLPYYLHNVKEFGRITVLGEFLAVSSVIMCLLFIIVDMGMPTRLFNVLIYATPHSVMFWDMVVLNGYLLLNILIAWNVLEAERNSVAPPKWVKALIYVSIPWAFSIHTVTAFLYSGLAGRDFWLTALIAPKFLASAFATGPALLIILTYILKRYANFDAGKAAVQKLSLIVTYALVITLFMIAVEFFTAFYSKVPGHMLSLRYLFMGIEGHGKLVPLMWLFVVLAVFALVILLNPKMRRNDGALLLACVAVFVSMLIEKGISFVVGGFIPNPFETVTEYVPTLPEIMVSLGIWAVGLFLLSVFYKLVISVKAEVE